jgi:hypothetical protein
MDSEERKKLVEARAYALWEEAGKLRCDGNFGCERARDPDADRRRK